MNAHAPLDPAMPGARARGSRRVDGNAPEAYKAGSAPPSEDTPVPLAILLVLAALMMPAASAVAGTPPARYAADGRLDLPADYREWIYLSTGLDMSYSEGRTDPDHAVFDNVFVDPASWDAFKQGGHWPDGTRFVLEVRRASSQGSILKQGSYQTGEIVDIEMHVRDDARFPGGWGFFTFEGKEPAQVLPRSARCYACHEAHGTVDTTFTQFYPTARAIAIRSGTFRPEATAPAP